MVQEDSVPILPALPEMDVIKGGKLNMREIVGYVLVSIPFLVILVVAKLMVGWKGLLIILLSVSGILVLSFAGVYLIKGG